MRTSQRVTFLGDMTEEFYNDETGDWEGGLEEAETLPAFVMDLGIDRSVELFGEYQKGRKVVMLQRPFLHDFRFIEIDGVRYIAVNKSQHRTVFHVEEVG